MSIVTSEKLMSQFDINAGHIGGTAYESMAGEPFKTEMREWAWCGGLILRIGMVG
jgi:hypothetical protein